MFSTSLSMTKKLDTITTAITIVVKHYSRYFHNALFRYKDN